MPHTKSGIYWEEQGGEQPWRTGPTLVVLPGFGSDVSLMRVLTSHLHDQRIVLLDLPGHGRSNRAPADVVLSSLAETVWAAMTELEATQCHLLGYSLGGAIARRIALDHPHGVRSLVALAPWNAAGTTPEDPVMAGFDAAFGDVRALREGVAAISQSPDLTQGLVDSMLSVTEQMWHGWLSGGAFIDESDDLPNLKVPTCYIVAGKDAVIDPIKQLDDIRRVPGGRAVQLSDLGHLCGLEQPHLVAREIRAYLDSRADPVVTEVSGSHAR